MKIKELPVGTIFGDDEIGRIGKLPLVNDFKSGPGGITHMMGPAGMFSLNPKDSVLATTNRINDGLVTGGEGSLPVGGSTLTKDDVKTAFQEALSLASLTSRIEHGDLTMAIDSGLGGRR